MANPEIHFVISAPRSGSTWLCNSLNVHPEIFATEQRLFGMFSEVWKNINGTTSPRVTFDSFAAEFSKHYFHQSMGLDQEQFLRRFQKGFVNFLVSFAQRQANKKIVVDKITPYHKTSSIVREQIENLFPESKVIQLVRDGRDVVTSGAFDWLTREATGSPRREFFVDGKPGTKLIRFFDDPLLRQWADHWRETIAVFGERTSGLQIRYENMKQDQAAELTRLFDFLGVKNDPEIAKACEAATTFEKVTGRQEGELDPTAKARRGIAGDWKNWFTRQDGELFHQIAGAELIGLGYEKDATWVQSLPEELALQNP